MTGQPSSSKPKVVWRGADGSVVSCHEKIKVLGENLEELSQMAQDSLEDAVLMGCDEKQIREELHRMIDELVNPYQSRKMPDSGSLE